MTYELLLMLLVMNIWLHNIYHKFLVLRNQFLAHYAIIKQFFMPLQFQINQFHLECLFPAKTINLIKINFNASFPILKFS